MKEKIDWKHIKTKELAGLLSQHLKEDGIDTILVGGSCVTIYSNNRYLSYDLDYVSHAEFKEIEASLKKIGFIKKGRHLEHKECPFLIEFLLDPVAIGEEIIRKFKEVKTKYGAFRLLMVDDCVKDRLLSFYHWSDRQGLNQAIEVCLDHKVNIEKIHKWSKKIGFEPKFLVFKAELEKAKRN